MESDRRTVDVHRASLPGRKLASYPSQMRILLWKNSLLLRRNKLGTLSELFAAVSLLIGLLIIRFLLDVSVYYEESSRTVSASSPLTQMDNVSSNSSFLVYYPNNDFIKSIVTKAYTTLSQSSQNFSATGDLSVIVILT